MAKNLEQQIAELEAALTRKRSQARERERRDDTRRKIIYGSAILTLLGGMSEARRAETLASLHDKITRPTDRAFLGLPEEKGARPPKTTARPPSEPAKVQGSRPMPAAPRGATAPSPPTPVMPRAEPTKVTPSDGPDGGWGELPFPM